MSLLEITDLNAGYGKTPVLHGVTVRVGMGEVVAVFGANGAGKSTLVKAIFGLVATSAGSVRFDGDLLAGVAAERIVQRGLACVPQEENIFPSLTVEENLRVAEAGLRAAAANGLGRLYEIFPILRERRRQRAGTLSGGERQMLAIASTMIAEPRLLVLDEPTSGLAPIIVGQLIEQTLDFALQGTTILWIVGDSAERILPRVDRAYLLQSGLIGGEWAAGELGDEASIVDLYFQGHGAGLEVAPAEGLAS